MEVPAPPVTYAYHRTVDPADPPRELSGLAWGAFVSLGVLALLCVVRLVTALHLHSAVSGRGDIQTAYHTYHTWVGLSGLVFLVSAGVFIAWFFRAYKNLRRLGVQNLRYGDGWAIGYWFIPIFNMFRPKQIANDIWRGSERGVEVSTQWRLVDVPSLVHWWWGLYLVQGLLVYLGQSTSSSGYGKLTSFTAFESGLGEIKTGTVLDVLGELVSIAAIVLAIMVVSQVTVRLDEIRNDVLAVGPVGPVHPAMPPTMAPAMTSAPPPVAPVAPMTTSYPPPQPFTEGRVRCPRCAEWIQPQAKLCRFCGHHLQ